MIFTTFKAYNLLSLLFLTLLTVEKPPVPTLPKSSNSASKRYVKAGLLEGIQRYRNQNLAWVLTRLLYYKQQQQFIIYSDSPTKTAPFHPPYRIFITSSYITLMHNILDLNL